MLGDSNQAGETMTEEKKTKHASHLYEARDCPSCESMRNQMLRALDDRDQARRELEPFALAAYKWRKAYRVLRDEVRRLRVIPKYQIWDLTTPKQKT